MSSSFYKYLFIVDDINSLSCLLLATASEVIDFSVLNV